MATTNQRGTAVCDALLNAVATAQQKQRILAAFGDATGFIRELRNFVISRVQQHEEEAGRQAVRSQVIDDFTEV